MTYAQLLLIFVVLPTAALTALVVWDWRRARGAVEGAPGSAGRWPALVSLLILIAVATVYTFPWDDHLIALGVWWYRPSLIDGVFLDHVPLEELFFFPLQTLLVGMWFIWLAPHVAQVEAGDGAARGGVGRLAIGALGALVWLAALAALVAGWRRGTYLGWEVAWAAPPIILQTLVGGDILWRRRWLVLSGVLPVTLYLCCVDALAISTGIWAINPRQSVAFLIGGALPLEEMVFFLVTTTLVGFGVVLGSSLDMRRRIRQVVADNGGAGWGVRLTQARSRA